MDFIEILKAFFFGVVEGITEWLPISSTGHMILLNQFVKMDVSDSFWEMFLVVVQLGAILAVVLLFWNKIFPFSFKGSLRAKRDVFSLWGKILVACIPAAIVGILWEDQLDALFYNYVSVAIALVVFGVLFIWIEKRNQGRVAHIQRTEDITYRAALLIGIFQLIAAIFPGTSRSGATILGGLMIGMSCSVAAEFTFSLAVPVMFGASLLKLVKFGLAFTATEAILLGVGLVAAFLVSLLVIRFLMGYIRRHDFKVFGWYRIILGLIVLAYFFINR